MNDDELKKRLAILKTAPVPKGYWASYWPRLKMKLDRPLEVQRAPRAGEHRPWPITNNWFVPALTAIFIGLAGYRWGGYQAMLSAPASSALPIQLASQTSETEAQRVFREMLTLFPNRVNWISFVQGKVDFSISSVAHGEREALVPLVIALPRQTEAFETRLLIRAGETARAEGAWDKDGRVSIQAQLRADGRHVVVSCRLNGAGLETEVDVTKPGTQPLGSFRIGERLVQVQLTRVQK
jgi:hypothetical protein